MIDGKGDSKMPPLACLTLSTLNDSRYAAFCESDFASNPGFSG
jgi:hypothetical protein